VGRDGADLNVKGGLRSRVGTVASSRGQGGGPMSYAVVLSDRPHDVAGVLVMLEDKAEAELIAIEVRAAGHKVEVREVSERLAGWKVLPTAGGIYA
jgi:hypothetical protein